MPAPEVLDDWETEETPYPVIEVRDERYWCPWHEAFYDDCDCELMCCPGCHEPWCPKHELHYADCACLGLEVECSQCEEWWDNLDGDQLTCPLCGGLPVQVAEELMPDLSTPTGEIVHVGAIEVVVLSDPEIANQLFGAIEEAKSGAGTTNITPGSRQRYSIVVDPEQGIYGVSVHA